MWTLPSFSRGQWSEFSAAEIGGKMVHPPDGRLHFKQEWCVLALMFWPFMASIGKSTVLAIQVNLGEDST